MADESARWLDIMNAAMRAVRPIPRIDRARWADEAGNIHIPRPAMNRTLFIDEAAGIDEYIIDALRNKQRTNNEEAIMSKADRDYTLLDLKRLDYSLIVRKLDKIGLTGSEQSALLQDYKAQLEYIYKMAVPFPQVLTASYMDLMGIGDNADWASVVTDKQEINKHLMGWIEQHSAPRLEGRELSDYELGQVVTQYANVAKQAVAHEISCKQSDMRSANERLISYAQEVENYKRKLADLERELTAAIVRAHSAADVGHLEGLFKQQIELIQSRLNWQYVAFFKDYFWFRTPMNTMVRRESGRTDTVETCSYLVGFMPMSQCNGGWRVMPITGNLLERNYGCPFHSGSDWCYGSGYNQAKDQLLSGDMFAAARTMSYLMTTYQADGPYRVFDEYKRGSAPMPNWTHSPWCGTSTFRPLNFIYGDGDWEQMVDRALAGKVHLDGDYTNPISPINRVTSANQRFRFTTSPTETEHISYTMKDVIVDNVEGVESSGVSFWDCGEEEDGWLTDEQQFNDRLTSGMPFYIATVNENDYSYDDYYVEYDVNIHFEDGTKASYDYHIACVDDSCIGDRPSTLSLMRDIVSRLMGSQHYEAIGLSANEVDRDLYDCINQKRVRALMKLDRDVLERKCLTEILAQLSITSINIGSMHRLPRLESLEMFTQPTTQETTDVSND